MQRVEIRRRRYIQDRPGERVAPAGDLALIDTKGPRAERPRVDTSRPVLTLSSKPKSPPVSAGVLAPVEKRVDPLLAQGVEPLLVKRHREMEAAYGFGLPVPLPAYTPSSTQAADLWIECVDDDLSGYTGASEGSRQASLLAEESGPIASTALHDLESLSWHLDQAVGTVLVAGLGLGVLVHALCAKSTVSRIIVLEPDATAFQLFRISALPFAWTGYDHKVQVIIGDPFAPEAKEVVRSQLFGRRPDYMVASLWPEIPDAEAAEDTKRLVKAFDPVSAGWWGQELELASWLESRHLRIDEHNVARFFRESGVPCRPSPGYLEFCIDVAKAAGYDVAP